MADRFHLIEDAVVILRNNGTFKQAQVYRRGNGLYAGLAANSFIQLYRKGTSHPSVLWDDLELPFEQVIGQHDRLQVPDHWNPEAKIIEHEKGWSTGRKQIAGNGKK